jgi:zinc protease
MTRYSVRARLILAACMVSYCASASGQTPVRVPELSTKRLMNDLQVVVAPTPYLGENMTIGLVVRYGSAFNPAEKGGVANLLSLMFAKATVDRTLRDIREELAYLDARLEIKSDWDCFRITLSGPSSKFERSLLLLYQVICEAQFNDDDFTTVKQEILNELQRPPDPRQRIYAQFEQVLFAGTTYGRPLTGTQKSLAGITVGDVRHFYNKFFTPNDASLLVVGNISPIPALQMVSRIWGIWVRRDQVAFTFAQPRKPAGRMIFLEDDASSPAAQFVMGNLFPRREDPDYTNTLLAARILQDRLTRLLPTSLLTVGSEGRRMAGPFFIRGQAAADQAVDQILKIQNAAENMQQALVSREELAAAKTSLIEDFNRELSATDGLCRILLDAELYRLGSNYAVSYPDQINRCDAEAIRAAAKQSIFPGGVVLLVRGPAATLKPALEILGTVQPIVP